MYQSIYCEEVSSSMQNNPSQISTLLWW